jgi:golgi SNAP receptor complex member 1
VKAALDQKNLLSGVRNDIEWVLTILLKRFLLSLSTYKSSAADSLLAERGRIDSSHQMMDDLLR